MLGQSRINLESQLRGRDASGGHVLVAVGCILSLMHVVIGDTLDLGP